MNDEAWCDTKAWILSSKLPSLPKSRARGIRHIQKSLRRALGSNWPSHSYSHSSKTVYAYEQATKNPCDAFTCAALVFVFVYLSKNQWLMSKPFRQNGSISKTPWRLFHVRSSSHSRPKKHTVEARCLRRRGIKSASSTKTTVVK